MTGSAVVAGTDPVTFIGGAALLGAIDVVATLVPARRAARINPVDSLRME